MTLWKNITKFMGVYVLIHPIRMLLIKSTLIVYDSDLCAGLLGQKREEEAII
jgi:hypothetical protein